MTSTWTQGFSRVAIHRVEKGPYICRDLAPRIYPRWQEPAGSTGVCVLSRYVQLLNSLEEGAPARHWLELLNKANFSCQRMWNLQRAKEITWILCCRKGLEKGKKSWYDRVRILHQSKWLLNVVKYSKPWSYFKEQCEFQCQHWIYTVLSICKPSKYTVNS